MTTVLGELRSERRPLRLTVRRRHAMVLAIVVPVALVAVYVATNVSASLEQRSLRTRWEQALKAGPVDTATLAAKTFHPGEPVSRIAIRAIRLDLVVVEGGDGRRAPAHVARTVIPGMPGLSAINGNRFAFGNQFLSLQRLVAGDEILVQTLAGERRFLVRTVETVPQSSVDLSVDTETPTLLLLSPARAWGGADRVVVRAEIVSSENQ